MFGSLCSVHILSAHSPFALTAGACQEMFRQLKQCLDDGISKHFAQLTAQKTSSDKVCSAARWLLALLVVELTIPFLHASPAPRCRRHSLT